MVLAKIFKCSGNEMEIIPSKLLEDLKISFEAGNKNASDMALLAKALKTENKKEYCRLPFCHTVEAEALGSQVIFSETVGNRIGKYKIEDINSLDHISKIDLTKGRIAEVIKAARILKEEGEKLVLDVTGPISIASSIMDSSLFYKALRKNREKIDVCLGIIEDTIVEYILEAVELGVDIISFADPTGTIDIVGPKVYKDVSGKVTYRILKRIENQLGKTLVHLCGKTSTSLEAIGLLESEILEARDEDYFQMMQNIKAERDDIKFIGHWCLKLNTCNKQITSCRIK